jgi:hypothetical protein
MVRIKRAQRGRGGTYPQAKWVPYPQLIHSLSTRLSPAFGHLSTAYPQLIHRILALIHSLSTAYPQGYTEFSTAYPQKVAHLLPEEFAPISCIIGGQIKGGEALPLGVPQTPPDKVPLGGTPDTPRQGTPRGYLSPSRRVPLGVPPFANDTP